ncbi:MAG: arginyltransferase [Alphaproteobacteria bacterium]|nr:arginyltransferase [Alphaproteobacteria bacterium]
MSNQRLPTRVLTFYRSGPMPCPYLDGKAEQQLFAELTEPAAARQFDILSQGGFRRSHQIVYRPACTDCCACVPVRVVAADFEPSRSWRRVINANRDLQVTEVGDQITEEQYRLFRDYTNDRHGDGDMAKMNRREYAAMVVNSPVDTGLVEFRAPDDRLIAVCLKDRLADGLSAVYSFFAPDEAKRSLGSYVVLWLIGRAHELGLDYVYLGYWVPGSRKMEYKTRFRPIEAFSTDGWCVLDDEAIGAGSDDA